MSLFSEGEKPKSCHILEFSCKFILFCGYVDLFFEMINVGLIFCEYFSSMNKCSRLLECSIWEGDSHEDLKGTSNLFILFKNKIG